MFRKVSVVPDLKLWAILVKTRMYFFIYSEEIRNSRSILV